ncbi:uncharacterized protein LOC115334469 [Aquila chrysaetos chrysaetos]|uniref:uncharacterized protein LOC115334469 n=1 Tax=Aquila chrysaetos chrysaetos TaxID=223781 RepID=UPI0011772463|nr:uncharacterized protein LOC115334469 [Aquila chrysaetos chrysaetos]
MSLKSPSWCFLPQAVAHANMGWLRNGWKHLRFGWVPALIKGHIQHLEAGENHPAERRLISAGTGQWHFQNNPRIFPATGRHGPRGEKNLGVQRSGKALPRLDPDPSLLACMAPTETTHPECCWDRGTPEQPGEPWLQSQRRRRRCSALTPLGRKRKCPQFSYGSSQFRQPALNCTAPRAGSTRQQVSGEGRDPQCETVIRVPLSRLALAPRDPKVPHHTLPLGYLRRQPGEKAPSCSAALRHLLLREGKGNVSP